MVHQISQPSTGHQPVPWNAHLPRPRRVPSRPARGPRCTAPAPQPTPRFHQRCWSIFSQQLWCMSLKKCQIYNQKTIIIGYHRYNMLYMFFFQFFCNTHDPIRGLSYGDGSSPGSDPSFSTVTYSVKVYI